MVEISASEWADRQAAMERAQLRDDGAHAGVNGTDPMAGPGEEEDADDASRSLVFGAGTAERSDAPLPAASPKRNQVASAPPGGVGASSPETTPGGGRKLRSSVIVQDLLRSAEQLSEEQVAEFKECFSLFDGDGSGSVDTSELGEVMKSLGQKMTDEELEEMIRNVDADGSGTVDFAEFLGMMALQMHDHDSDVILTRMFRLLARDQHSDVLRVDDLNYVLGELCEKMTTAEIEGLTREASGGSDVMDLDQFMRVFVVGGPEDESRNSSRKSLRGALEGAIGAA